MLFDLVDRLLEALAGERQSATSPDRKQGSPQVEKLG
jgi:hypothetical protein